MKRFSIHIPESEIAELNARLRSSRWPMDLQGPDWAHGTDLKFLQELIAYWRTSFSWRNCEEKINFYDQFQTSIEGNDIHFLHVTGNGRIRIPLLVTHGWPGSFIECIKLIPLLTAGSDFSFDLVIPSLPGFGFSSKPHYEGCNSKHIAKLWHSLMLRLGYDKYAVQGGDIGAGVSSWIAKEFPSNVLGIHLNYIPGSYLPHIPHDHPLTIEEEQFRSSLMDWRQKEGAYIEIQRTKPQTLSYGLNDSPLGLCAWISEKFYSWSDRHEDNRFKIGRDDLLANVSLYWFTQSIRSSIQIYYENNLNPFTLSKGEKIIPPMAFARFPKELPTPPRSYVERGYNLERWTVMPRGGHFAALEEPEFLANDIAAFFKSVLQVD